MVYMPMSFFQPPWFNSQFQQQHINDQMTHGFKRQRTQYYTLQLCRMALGPKWLQNKGLHFCHLNVHYLYPKLDEIKMLLQEQDIDILCLCETFLNQDFSDDELKVGGYNFIRKDRQSPGAGLIIYIKSYLSYTRHVDMETNDLESIWVEFKHNKQKTFFTYYCYRPPSSSIDWINKFENNTEREISGNREIINIDSTLSWHSQEDKTLKKNALHFYFY